jgi:hypothetical protein
LFTARTDAEGIGNALAARSADESVATDELADADEAAEVELDEDPPHADNHAVAISDHEVTTP